MKVCAEFEDQLTALNAHRALIDQGADPEDVEIRSPYPLAEEPIPAHRSKPMVMRTVVRLAWLFGVLAGFSFLTFTQLEWGLTAKTGGQPLVAIPINCIPMYECGMILGILMTTLMFFVETRRYRQLVPPLEEDMPVAIGYIALVVSGDSAKKAQDWLKGAGARNIVTYMVPIMLLGMFTSGCATNNMRYQPGIKPLEKEADRPPLHSIRMPLNNEQGVEPPLPFGYLHYGDVKAYERGMAEVDAKEELWKENPPEGMSKGDQRRALRAERDFLNEEYAPEIIALKGGSIPKELQGYVNPLKDADAKYHEMGKELYRINCSQCHGPEGAGDGKVGEAWGSKPLPIGNREYLTSLDDGGFYYYISTGKNQMPEFGQKLNAEEIWSIVLHLRDLQSR